MVSAQIIAFTKQEAVLSDLPDKLHEEAQGFTSMIADLEEIPKKKKKLKRPKRGKSWNQYFAWECLYALS